MPGSVRMRIVSRDDQIYEAFPDVAMTPDGTLVCLYRESMAHAPFPFSRIAVRRSLDGGNTWSEKTILAECAFRPEQLERHRRWMAEDEIAGYGETLGRIAEDWQLGAWINCPRLVCLADGSLFLAADITLTDATGKERLVNKIWRSRDRGATWSGPEDAKLETPGIVPSVTQLRDGTILLGANVPEQGPQETFCATAWLSRDNGESWSDGVPLPVGDGREIDETSFVELDDGTVVGFGRNWAAERAQRPGSGLKVVSRDGGRTWSGPFETRLLGLEGRPKAGLLRSGEVCVTFRLDLPNEMLAMHVMTQEAAKSERPNSLVPRRPTPADVPAEDAGEEGRQRPWYMTHYYPGRTFVLDCDRSVHRDAGYSGWVQLPSGDIFVVDYINDDAPLAHIRSYLVRRSDYMLFPEGDLPWLHPSWQPFRRIAESLAERQRAENRRREDDKS